MHAVDTITRPRESSQGKQNQGKPAEPRRRTDAAQPLITRLAAAGALPQYVQQWLALADRAVVRNVFYEPWALLPAIDCIAGDSQLSFLLVFAAGVDGAEDTLVGFFPFEVRSNSLGAAVRSLAFWQHRYCFLAVPLIDSALVWPVLDAFWRWFEQNPLGCRILDTNYLVAEGEFHKAWADFAIGRTSFLLNDFPRAFLDGSASAVPYIPAGISKKHMTEYQRQERRLRELGSLEFRQVSDASEVDAWVDEFLELEAAGWKGGEDGGAFARRSEDAAYLRTVTREGFGLGRAMLLSLTLNGKAIAMKHNLLTSDGGYAFKIAFDEKYFKYSPGVLLEFENIRRVCASDSIPWMDSCAIPRHPMADRLWNSRRMIRRTLFSDGSRYGDLSVSALPLLRFFRRVIRPRPVPEYLRISTQKEQK